MPGDRTRIYWDTNCFLYYINNHPQWVSTLGYHLRRAADEKAIEIVTSVLTITEAAFTASEALSRALRPEDERALDNMWQSEGILPVELNIAVARLARDLNRQRLERGWSYPGAPDLIHLATALLMEVAEMHTIDEKLHRYSDLIGLRVCYPPPEPANPDPPLMLPGMPPE